MKGNCLRVIVLFALLTIGNVKTQAQYYPSKDTLFKAPYIDKDEWRETPVRHRYVHGGFKGTETRFSFYFPPKEKYKGHFFQYITPVPDNENLSQGAAGEGDKIGFSISNGAYFIETNGGGAPGRGSGPATGPIIGAYGANAACANYSRTVAAQMYRPHRTYGYSFGGSGGAYRTVGGLENTDGVWDGAVPYVLGSPMAIPNVFTVRIHAMRILHDKFPQIADAVEPGGANMYAGLNDEEKQALTRLPKWVFRPKHGLLTKLWAYMLFRFYIPAWPWPMQNISKISGHWPGTLVPILQAPFTKHACSKAVK